MICCLILSGAISVGPGHPSAYVSGLPLVARYSRACLRIANAPIGNDMELRMAYYLLCSTASCSQRLTVSRLALGRVALAVLALSPPLRGVDTYESIVKREWVGPSLPRALIMYRVFHPARGVPALGLVSSTVVYIHNVEGMVQWMLYHPNPTYCPTVLRLRRNIRSTCTAVHAAKAASKNTGERCQARKR